MGYGAILGQTNVKSFNGRSGIVIPQAGDYTAAEVGAAPAGFGLGNNVTVNAPIVNDLDSITLTGWYTGAPVLNGIQRGNTPTTHVAFGDGYASQTAYLMDATSGLGKQLLLYRTQERKVWQPWEYVNPPMQLGVEYRTTERYNGKPVYKKLVDIGYLPNNSTKAISDWASDVYQVIEVYGRAHVYAIPTEYYGSDGSYVRIFAGSTVIYVSTNSDRSDTPASVVVKYTKTTD